MNSPARMDPVAHVIGSVAVMLAVPAFVVRYWIVAGIAPVWAAVNRWTLKLGLELPPEVTAFPVPVNW